MSGSSFHSHSVQLYKTNKIYPAQSNIQSKVHRRKLTLNRAGDILHFVIVVFRLLFKPLLLYRMQTSLGISRLSTGKVSSLRTTFLCA